MVPIGARAAEVCQVEVGMGIRMVKMARINRRIKMAAA
jgi:hypothetical protein